MREALRKKLPELMKKILADCLTTDIKGLENLENFRSKERIITVIKIRYMQQMALEHPSLLKVLDL